MFALMQSSIRRATAKSSGIRPGDTVLIVGCGGVGLSAIQAARIVGVARVIVVDPEPKSISTTSAGILTALPSASSHGSRGNRAVGGLG